jgi:DNA replication protein DnaC
MQVDELKLALQNLRLSEFANQYDSVAKKCEDEKLGHIDYLKALVEIEVESRYHKRIKSLLKKSKIPRSKDIKDFDVNKIPDLSQSKIKELARGDFIDRSENLLIFGNPGTGKTHLAIALTQEWCYSGRRALFTTAAELIQTLLKAKENICWNECVQRLNKNDVIIIDDISYIPCDRKETDLLFLLLSSRYENKSIVITSNLPFSKWNEVFKDEMTTAAAIDRLVHHSVILQLNTESYRKKAAKERLKKIEVE